MRLQFTDATDTNGSLTVRRFAGAAPENARLLALTVQGPDGPITPDVVSDDRYWTIEAASLSGFTYTVCLDASALPGVPNPSGLVLVKRAQSEADWVPQPTTLEQVGERTFLCTAGLSSFSQFGIGANRSVNPLPVELTAFEALTDGTEAVLRWTTASETNNAGFEIQAKAGAADWQAVTFVEGQGTTTAAQAY